MKNHFMEPSATHHAVLTVFQKFEKHILLGFFNDELFHDHILEALLIKMKIELYNFGKMSGSSDKECGMLTSLFVLQVDINVKNLLNSNFLPYVCTKLLFY